MKRSCITLSVFSMLLAGSALEIFAAEPATTAAPSAPKLAFATPLQWKSTDVLIKAVSDATHEIVSVKDPTIVRYNDLWHIYATVYSTSARTWSMVYLNFKDWSEAPNAKLYYLDQNPNLRGYHCAPHVFYFRPHKKWYLIFQFNTGLTHLETFGELYVFSSGYWQDQLPAFQENIKPLLGQTNINDHFRMPIYFAAGEADIALFNSQRTLAVFNNHGVCSFWVLSSHGHEWLNWRRYLYQTVQIMFAEDR